MIDLMPALDAAACRASCYAICMTMTFFFVLVLLIIVLFGILVYLAKCKRG